MVYDFLGVFEKVLKDEPVSNYHYDYKMDE